MIQKLPIAVAQVKAGNTSKFNKQNQINSLFFVSSKENH